MTPREYADAVRLRKVKGRLRQPGDITGAMLDAGYGSSSRFYERAVPELGMAPSVYRRGGAGMQIGYTIVGANASLGRLLVAATSRGVCAVAMGSSDTRADARAVARVSGRRDHERRRRARAVDDVDPRASVRPEPRLDLPLDVQATAFQWQVWQALAAIPYGETRTYSEVAASIGNRGRCAPSRAPARPILSRSRFPVTASCRRPAAGAATVGESSGRKRC